MHLKLDNKAQYSLHRMQYVFLNLNAKVLVSLEDLLTLQVRITHNEDTYS